MLQPSKAKIGRNDLCPCGSGRKHKKCHGNIGLNEANYPQEPSQKELDQIAKELEAHQKQREKQQGLGQPIISIYFKGYRFVVVGNTIHRSKHWKTFHDFLLDYIKIVLGNEWGNSELKKNFSERHPICQWYDFVCKFQRDNFSNTKQIHSAHMTGAVAAYFKLAYNLYLLSHNATIQETLIRRLKNKDQFLGAYYETFVAAAFLKAGFDLEFENEADSKSSHCEFTAVHKETGAKYSVEAKARSAGKQNVDIGHQLYKALSKKANHSRLVFIDINVPDNQSKTDAIPYLNETLSNLRSKEASLTIHGTPAPEAYIIVSNHPFQYNLDSAGFRCSAICDGFKIPDFGANVNFPNIRTAVGAREKHYQIYKLMNSIHEHYEIPSTFDGEIPEIAFCNRKLARLCIGYKYFIPYNGTQLIGKLVDAAVLEKEKLAYGVYLLENGKSIIATSPLTDEELSAYRRYPDTFFGIYQKKGQKLDTPLELFDFLFENYRQTTKQKLLEFMKDRPDYEMLKDQSQEDLAFTYCEGIVNSLNNREINVNPSQDDILK